MVSEGIIYIIIYSSNERKNNDRKKWILTDIPFEYKETFKKAIIFEILMNQNKFDEEFIQKIKDAFTIERSSKFENEL